MDKLVLNHNGFKEILTSNACLNMVEQFARDVQTRAGTGFGMKTRIGGWGGSPRAMAVLFPETKEGYRAQYKNQALERAIGV
jgi:hypothetical protein